MKNTEQLEEGKCQEWELILLNILKQIMTNEIALNLGYVKVVEFFDKCEQQAILNERQRIIELITKYDLIPPQVKMESPRYWKGYEDTVNIILEKLTQRIYEKNKYD